MIPLTLDEIVRVIEGRSDEPAQPFSITGVSIDSRTTVAGDLFFAIRGDRFDGHDFAMKALQAGGVAAIVERPVAIGNRLQIRVGATVTALGKLAAFHREQRSFTVIAVTGSNGKTTTKSMIDHVLSRRLRGRSAQRSFNNHIGVPLTLLSAKPGDEYLVVEIGANAMGEVAALSRLASPNIAVITSSAEAHLVGFGSVEVVAREKASLLDGLRAGGLAVVNADALELSRAIAARDKSAKTVTFGFGESADVRVTACTSTLDGVAYTLNGRFTGTLGFPGRHNALNAAAAFAVCRRLNVEPEVILNALSTFEPPPMRLNVSRLGGLTLLDDSYNANPASMRAAIDLVRESSMTRDLSTSPPTGQGRRVFIVGDMLELGDDAALFHERTGRLLREAQADLVIAVGSHAEDVVRGAAGGETRSAADAESVCASIEQWLRPTDVVLVKGSRRVELDRVARRIRDVFGAIAPLEDRSLTVAARLEDASEGATESAGSSTRPPSGSVV